MRIIHLGLSLALLAACAKSPDRIQPKFASATPYRALGCDQLNEERARLASELARLEGMQRENANADAAMMAVGLVLFWPALFGLAATTDRAETIAAMKGERDAMELAAREKGCPPPGLIVSPAAPPAAEATLAARAAEVTPER
jgi:hypothetical protein